MLQCLIAMSCNKPGDKFRFWMFWILRFSTLHVADVLRRIYGSDEWKETGKWSFHLWDDKLRDHAKVLCFLRHVSRLDKGWMGLTCLSRTWNPQADNPDRAGGFICRARMRIRPCRLSSIVIRGRLPPEWNRLMSLLSEPVTWPYLFSSKWKAWNSRTIR